MLPQSNSDFIFAIIIEEYGLFFGAIPLILAYMILLFRGITIAKKCETAFPAFLVLGLIVMIVIQAMLNMMVAVGLFPGYRADTSNGKLGKDICSGNEFFNRCNTECKQGSKCKNKKRRTARRRNF